jgi:hypothetical protein
VARSVEAATFPEGRLVHDLRRSVGRTLVDAGIDLAGPIKIGARTPPRPYSNATPIIFTDKNTAAGAHLRPRCTLTGSDVSRKEGWRPR